MTDLDTPPAPPPRTRVRWWIPALFVLSILAASVAVYASIQIRNSRAPIDLGVVDFSSLGDEAPQERERAPDFSVVTTDGAEFSLSNHLATDGRPVFLNLWASWCLPCRVEMPAIDVAAAAHPEVLFIGVSVRDSESDARAFLEEIGIDYLIGLDLEGSVDEAYPALGLPASYLIGSDGTIVDRHFGQVTVDSIEEKLRLLQG